MSEHYDFHYQPTGSGAISGQQVLQQTEDAINELGDYVNDNIGGAMDVAQQALETAQNAEQDAQTALDTANSFSSAIQSAQQDASTALSTAQTAQTTASNANNTAIQAQQDANTAVTTANNASGQVSTLSGTVTTLGQRVTTAEGNISQNASDITALTTRVGTAEGNITTLQNDVTIAQGNASSAMATAGQVKQQAFVFRYSSTALVASSTNSNTLLDNTDNLKVGDKVIDSNGVLFSITAIDTANSTFTVGSALVDLALDANVVHTSGNETISGDKVFNNRLIKNIDVVLGTAPSTGKFSNIDIADNNKTSLLQILGGVYDNGTSYTRFFVQNKTADDGTGLSPTGTLRGCGFNINLPASSTSEGQGSITPRANKTTDFGLLSYQWRNLWCEKLYLNGTQLDPSAFALDSDVVHKSGDETIGGNKTFSNRTIFSTTSANGELTLRQNAYDPATNGQSALSSTCSFNITTRSVTNGSFAQIGFYGAPGFTTTRLNCRYYTGASESEETWVEYTVTGTSGSITGRSFKPSNNGIVDLGTNANRWKDVNTYLVNGLTPSSLSLPGGNVSDVIDISSYITALDGTSNSYTVPANGWISIAIVGTAIAIVSSSWSDSRLRASSGNVSMLYPVLKNETLDISVMGTTLAYARFIPCQGNV